MMFSKSSKKAVVVLSNCEVRDCGGAGLKAEEGSTLNLLNCQVQMSSVYHGGDDGFWCDWDQSSYAKPNRMVGP